jgi:hypothetical protein
MGSNLWRRLRKIKEREFLKPNQENCHFIATIQKGGSYLVKLAEAGYFIIQGEFGVFGIYVQNFYVIRFSHDYIRSFGLTAALSF